MKLTKISGIALLATGFFAGAGVGQASAVVSISVGAVTVTTGGSSSIDVTLTNATGSAVELTGFSFELTVTDPDIQFSSATTSTAQTYVFNGNSSFGPTISTSVPDCTTLPGTCIAASDLTASGFSTVGAGATVGLGHVLFSDTAGDTPGPVTVTLQPFSDTSLSDQNLANVTFSGSNGSITVQSAGGAPEPTSWLLALLAIPAAGLLRKRLA